MVINKKQNISIKGTKTGLLFILKEDCTFEEIIYELKNKLENSHNSLLDGPLTKITIKTGYRVFNKKQKELLKEAFTVKENLVIDSIESELDKIEQQLKDTVVIKTGTIRSGQVYQVDGNILFIGDINPGGSLVATGNIYIIGALKGIAHAGLSGDKESLIIASEMKPIQLRIVDVICNQFDKLDKKRTNNLFAYLKNDKIVIDNYYYFSQLNKTAWAIK